MTKFKVGDRAQIIKLIAGGGIDDEILAPLKKSYIGSIVKVTHISHGAEFKYRVEFEKERLKGIKKVDMFSDDELGPVSGYKETDGQGNLI